MDFRLYARVLWRFRLIVAAGFALALLLAALSVVRVSSSGVSYRRAQLWSTSMRLLVTQNGFPEGRLYAQKPTSPGDAGSASGQQSVDPGTPVADPARFNTLAILYAELATSDPVRRVMLRNGPIRGQIMATALRDDASGVLLPLIDLTAISTSPQATVALARMSAGALASYVGSEQRVNRVPTADRVVLRTLVQPRRPHVFQPRSKTMAIVVFLAVLLATIGLAFILENLRPRVQLVHEAPETQFGRPTRRSA